MQYRPKHNKELEEENRVREEKFEKEKNKKLKKKKIIKWLIIIVILIFISWISYKVISPGKYDDFAKCLTEEGVKMYGEDWCKYTLAQKGMFGKSFKFIDYEVKTGLRKRPTWIINGETYETVQSFERLSELTGCEY